LLGTIIGTELAFKLVLVVVLLLTPLSFYYFARKLELSAWKSSVLMLAMYAVLFIVSPDEHLGGNMHATFNVGLVSNALGLMLLFFYLGKLKDGFKTGKFAGASALMALIVLSHVFTAIVAALAFAAFALAYVRSKKDAVFAFKHVALSLGLTAFWVIPFIANINYSRSIEIAYAFIPYMGLLFVLAAGYLAAVIYKKDDNFLPISVFILLLLAFMFVGDAFLHLPLHFYRFQMFFYLIVPVALMGLIGKKDKLFLALIVIVSAFVLFSVQDLHPEGTLDLPIFYDIPEYTDGRMMVVASPGNQASPHIYQHVVPLKSGNFAVKGLFVESSPNARYVFDLERGLDQYSLVWGSQFDPKSLKANYSIIRKQLDLFNINYVFSFYQADDSWKKLKRITFFNNYVDGEMKRYFYDVYRVGNSSLVQALTYKPTVVENEWEDAVSRWFVSEKVGKVMVNAAVPDYVATGNETIEMLNVSEEQDYLKFKVDSPQPIPLLVKISEFPNWKAYQDGVEIPVYRASPYLMLVYGTGVIEMRFENTTLETITVIITVLSALACVLLLLKSVYSRTIV